jgi:sugar porter (SP) family MFS transporter
MISALYTAEIAPARIRGFLVSLTQFGIVIGILVTYIVNWSLAESGPGCWRWMFGAGMIPAVVFFAGLLFVPESPRWLALRGELDRARAVLGRIGGPAHAETELAAIRDAVDTETGSVRELFRKGLRRALIIGIVVSVLAQSVGINAIMYYSPTIFLNAGFQDNSSAFLAAVVVGVVNFLFTIAAVFWVDRFGRRPLLLAGIAGMFLSLAGASVIFRTAGDSGWVLAPILSFVALYAVSLGPIAWVLVSEIFTNRLPGIAMAICMSALYISDFIVSLTFPRLLETFGPNVFLMYAGICAAGFAYVFFAVPETKGRPLEEIERMWTPGV